MSVGFNEIFVDDTKNVEKVLSKEYLKSGEIAIIDQGRKDVIGYTSNNNYKICTDKRIIFGDHTRIFKYIDVPFIIGADGTKVLKIIDTDKYDYKYMYYYLLHSYIPNTGYNRHFKWVKELEFNIAEKIIQSRIVKKLDEIQEQININKKQIELLDELIKSQFVEMFGDPNVVKDDEKIELKSIMINANNGMARRGNDSDGNIVLRLVELQRNYIDYSNVNKIRLKDNEKKKYLLLEGDILFARVNGNPSNVGRCAYFKDIGENVYHNDHIIRVKFNLQKINPIYLCVLLNDEYGKGEFKNKIKTSAGQYTISQEGIEKVKVFLPPIELQNKFAEIVKQIDKQKIIYEKNIKILQELMDKLMDKYFN